MAPSPLQCLPRHPSTLIGILSLVSITHPGFFSPLLQPQEHTAQPLPWLDPPSTTSLLQHQPQTAAPHPPPGPCSLPGLPVGRWKMLDAGGAAKSQRELSSRSRCILRAGGRAVPGRGAQGSGTCSGMYPNGWGHLQCLLLGMPWGRWMALLSWGLTDIYCAKGTSPRRTSSQQNVPTLLPSATHLLPSPAASFGELPVPSNTSSMRPAPVPAASSLRHSFPIAGLRAPERSNLCHSAAGKRGHKDMGGSEWVLPASPFPVTIPGPAASRQPHGPTVPWRLLPWCAGVARAGRALAPCPVAVSSCFLLFFFFPPLNTSPRNAQGGGSTISHCEHLSLYCSARQNTACPANKHPFICRPRHWGIQGRCQHRTGLRQPLGPARPPLVIGPQCWGGAHCSRRHQDNG